jgi:shikimate kinase/shikimate 5-dehydrogenase
MKYKKIFAVAGNPISHSRSHALFNSVFNSAGYHYTRIQSDDINDVLEIASAVDIKGLNITHPLKKPAFQAANARDHISNDLQASNTLIFNDNIISAYNTDIYGAQTLLRHVKNTGKTILLGTGSAAETILLSANDTLKIWGRNSINLRKLFENYSAEIVKNPELSHFDTIINCLPHGVIPPFSFAHFKGKILDVNYDNNELKNIAHNINAGYIDGKEWLLRQAIASYKLFTDVDVDYSSLEDAFDNYKSKKTIFLVGFMGSGKTTFAKKLAAEEGYVYVDLDEYIEMNQNLSINEIFSLYGESGFRSIESGCLKALFKIISGQPEKYVVSLGGGIIENEENIELIKKIGEVIWLYLPLHECLKRAEPATRPLLRANPQALEKLYNSRLNKYASSSSLIIYNRLNSGL